MYLKFYNPTPQDFKPRVGDDDTVVVIPAKGTVIVSEEVGRVIDEQYPVLETSVVDKEEYKEYRNELTKEVKEKEKVAPKKTSKGKSKK